MRCTKFVFCSLVSGHPGDCAVRPQPGFQVAFLGCSADGALGGGAVGAGKSAALLIEPLRWIHLPGFTALILRKEQRDIEKAGGLWPKSLQLYSAFGGSPRASEYIWTFESGATIQFNYVDSRHYEKQHQGTEAGYIGFDELTHFHRQEFIYMLLRLRSPVMRAYWRATCNPDPDSWVRQMVDWWIGPDGWPMPSRANLTRYYLRRDGREIWADDPDELLRKYPRARPEHVKSFAFFPGKTEENRYLGEEYAGNIEEQDEETRDRWKGNWNARATKGRTFKPEWFLEPNGDIKEGLLVDAAPPGTIWVRPWDLAATAERDAVSGTSYTAGPLMGLHDGIIYFADAEIGRWDAGEVEKRVIATAHRDGKRVKIWFCRERAGAGKSVLDRFVRLLHGYDVDGDVESGEKEVRLRPLAAQAKHGHIRFVRGDYVSELIRHLLRLPDRPNDVGDAVAAGYQVLVGDEGEEQDIQELAESYLDSRGVQRAINRAADISGAGRQMQDEDDDTEEERAGSRYRGGSDFGW